MLALWTLTTDFERNSTGFNKDFQCIIYHSLATAFFVLGTSIGKENDGLPMGSALGSALARVVLIYSDVVFHASLQQQPASWPSLRGRLRVEVVAGADVLILEMRYMDDYFALWKCLEIQPPSVCIAIESTLKAPCLEKSPLEVDGGLVLL